MNKWYDKAMKLLKFSREEEKEIREQLKSSYDHLVAPPKDFMTSITHIIDTDPKNFTSLSIQEIEEFVVKQFGESEPLVHQISPQCYRHLGNSIRGHYHGNNTIDICAGGTGLIVPSFISIMSSFIFWIRHYELKDLITPTDHLFYSKYFWCFETYGLVIHNQNLKKSAS